MEVRVNPQQVIIAGENSFLGLSQDGGATRTHWASHWRVFWSEAGSGHVLLIDSALVNGLSLYTDNADLARFLQENVEYFLHEPFGDTQLPITPAVFQREGSPPSAVSELVDWVVGSARLAWSGLAIGNPWQDERGDKACTSACLAWCETWYRPRGRRRGEAPRESTVAGGRKLDVPSARRQYPEVVR